MVHSSESGESLVIGTLYLLVDDDDDGGNVNSVIEKILEQIESGATEVSVDLPGPLRSKGYIGYSGSVTPPPCTEGVNWSIALQIKPVSKKQMERYRKIAGSDPFGNIRPIQPLTDRKLISFVLTD